MGSEGRSGQLSPQRQQAMERLEEQARMQKRGDETDEQSFARFITSDPVGREMFADYRNSQLMDVLKSFGCAPDGKSAEWQPPRAEADVPTSEGLVARIGRWRRRVDGIGGWPVPDPGQSPCHSKRTKIAVTTSRSSGTE